MSASWKTIRVFISSTFRDMQAERDHLVRFVFPRLRERLLKHRIHLVDVDLRWGVTGDEDAGEVCREVIGECRPRFLCMLGGRYGWVPEGKACSITADEIDFGVLNPPPNDHGPVRAFFYFRHDAATARMVEDKAGDYREPEGSENASKLAALKKTVIAAGHTPHIYGEDATWDTGAKRLTGLKKFGDRVLCDLFKSISRDPELAARFTAESGAVSDEFAEEAEQMDAFIEERTERYVLGSRKHVLDKLEAFATAEPAVAGPNIFVLTGDPGSGKSALLAHFCRHSTLNPQLSTLLIPHFIGASTGSTDLRRTLRRLCHELARAAGNTETLPLDIKDLITHFQKLLAEAAGRRRVILVFDALNQFDATDGAHWLNWLPRELPPGVSIVASVIAPADGQPEHQTLAILRTRPGTRMEKLEPLTEADTLAIIEGCLRRYAKRLSPEQLAALLAKPASRLPLYILTALEELRTLGTYEEITDRMEKLPGDARALFGWILTERLARDPGFRDREGRPCGAALVEKFAACLGVSRHGLSPAELAALLDPGDPLGNVAALLRLLRPSLMHRGELLDFYHGQFREAAGASHLATPEKQRAAHQSVATCLQAFADPQRDGQCRDATPHALSELPHHQTRAEAWPDLIATLENIFFLEAKVTHGMAFDLAENFTAAVDALPPEHVERQRLRLLDEALRRDLHFIARHAQDYPQALFQCLWNSGWWYDCPEAASHYVVPENGWKKKPPWEMPDPVLKLSTLLQQWRQQREIVQPAFQWLRTLRPPAFHLNSGQLAVLRGHELWVRSAAFSPDSHLLASGSDDKTVRLWNGKNGSELFVLRGHEKPVCSVAFSPDCSHVASGSEDNTVRLWSTQNGLELAVLRGHESGIECVAFSPDGCCLVSVSNKTVRFWDTRSGREHTTLRRHKKGTQSIAFSPDGCRMLIGGSYDFKARLLDVESGSELVVFGGHEHHISSVAFSPDGRRVVSGSLDNTVRLWDTESGLELFILRGHKDWVNSAGFSADGCRVVSGSLDGTVRLWDAESGLELAVLRGHESGIECVAFSTDGCRVLSGSLDNTVRLWNSQNCPNLRVLRGHEKWINSVAFSPDGRRMLSGSWDHTVRLWDACNGHELAVMRGHGNSVDCVAFSPDSQRLFSKSWDGTVRLWDTQSGRELAVLRAHEREIECFAISPDGGHLLTGSRDKTMRLWDARSGRPLAIFRGHEDSIESVAFSPDGRQVVSGSQDKTVRLWDARSGRALAIFRGHEDSVESVAFSPDSRKILSGSLDKTARLWDSNSGAEVVTFRGHREAVWNVAFSGDGRRILSGSADKTVRLWDAQSGESLEVLNGNWDITAIAAGAVSFPWRAMVRDLETILEPADSGPPVAWFPETLNHITTHVEGRAWVGAVSGHLVLLRLGGG